MLQALSDCPAARHLHIFWVHQQRQSTYHKARPYTIPSHTPLQQGTRSLGVPHGLELTATSSSTTLPLPAANLSFLRILALASQSLIVQRLTSSPPRSLLSVAGLRWRVSLAPNSDDRTHGGGRPTGGVSALGSHAPCLLQTCVCHGLASICAGSCLLMCCVAGFQRMHVLRQTN